jgi:7-carboxy-7-deazaguanine synthase
MFGKNEIVGQKFFKDAEGLMVVSRFMTLQGEGPYRGYPAFFVRLAKCNLACSFCDTYFDNGDWFTVDELMKEVNSSIVDHFGGTLPAYMAGEKKEAVFVLTGGEPLLQKNINQLLIEVNKEFRYSQIESNGIIFTEIPDETCLVVSPKCLEKNGVAVRYLAPKAETLARANCLKFVMSADQNSPYSSVPDWAFEWRNQTGRPIFVSPMNMYNKAPRKFDEEYSTDNIKIGERSDVDEVISFWEEGLLDMKANQINHEYTAKYCVDHGLTFNLQQHLYAGLA